MPKEKTVKEEISKEEIKQADEFLKGYKLNRNLFRLDCYEKKRSEASEWDEESPDELYLARAKMFEIRHAIMELPNCDEKLMLYFHYIKGETIEKCAEMLGLSRSSAFRMRKRALELFIRKSA